MTLQARKSSGLLACALIALAAIAAYAGSLSGPFVLDDTASIAGNPTIRGLWRALSPPGGGRTVEGRPVLNLSLALNYAAGGESVFGYHAVNLAIHVLAGLVLFGCVRRTLERSGRDSPVLIAWAVALLWTLHPLQTEAVTYVIQRAESLMGLFYLLTLYGFIRGAEGPGSGRGWFALSAAACLLGMGSKEVMASAPLVVLLYDRTFVSGSFAEAWRRRRGVHLALASTWILLGFLVAREGDRGGTSGLAVAGLGGAGSASGAWAYWLTQFPAILRYLRLALWPHPLVFDYGTAWVSGFGEVLPEAAAVCALAIGTAFALSRPAGGRGSRAWRSAGFLGFWFFAVLAPTSLVPGNRQTMAEHRMYLALVPVVVLAVLGIDACVRRLRLSAVALAAGVLAAAAALGIATARRNADYRSRLRLYADTVAKVPGNAFAQNNLGLVLFSLGRVPEAIECYGEAVRLRPDYADARDNLGNALLHEGRAPEAAGQYAEALRLDPGLADARDNLGAALFELGRVPEAAEQFGEALRLEPGSAEVRNNLGNALMRLGRAPEAIQRYSEAIRLDPDYPEAHFNLGNALLASGRPEDAAAEFRSVLRLRPDYVPAHDNLGNALFQLGRFSEAVSEYREVIRLQPDHAVARFNLGNALLQLGRVPEAVAQFREALRLRPDFAAARQMLDRLQAD